MKGALDLGRIGFLLGLLAVILGLSVFLGGIKVQIQQAAPEFQGHQKTNMVTLTLWDLLVKLYDSKSKIPVSDANIYLLYEKPKNIYVTPTKGIAAAATGVNGKYVFESVDVGRTYYVLAEANGYYNALAEVNMPNELPENQVNAKQPVAVDVYMDKKGDILGVQVPLTYRGSSADVAKFVYDSDADNYKTEFSFVAGTDGVIKYKKLVIDLNTDALGSATIDTLKVYVGDKEFDFDNVTGAKTIKFDDEQTIEAGSTLPIKMEVEGTGFDAVSGQLFTVTLYDVQSGEWSATVEGPA